MKTIYSIICILFIANINAQEFDCSSKTKEYQDFFKALKVAESYTTWSEVVKNCPKKSETVYTDGIKILQYKIDVAASKEEKEKGVRDLMKLYDQYNKNFPLTTTDFEVNKAMALHNNKIDAKEEIFSLMDRGFSKGASNVTDANAIYIYFSLYYDKHKTDSTKFTADSVIEKQTLLNSLLTQLQFSNPEKATEYKTAQNGIAALAKDVTTCDNLAAYYDKNYPLNKENTHWIIAALTSMSEKCSSKPVFYTMAQQLYTLKITAQSAGFLALANVKQRKFNEAIRFYNESAELETNPLEKAKIYYWVATGLLGNDPAKSKEYLNKTLTFDPKMGKAYLFLAQLYSDSAEECGKTAFEKKAVYFLAIQTAKKAGIAEPRLKAASDKMAEDFAPKSLTKKEIRKKKMNGKSLTIGCWINETIDFPRK